MRHLKPIAGVPANRSLPVKPSAIESTEPVARALPRKSSRLAPLKILGRLHFDGRWLSGVRDTSGEPGADDSTLRNLADLQRELASVRRFLDESTGERDLAKVGPQVAEERQNNDEELLYNYQDLLCTNEELQSNCQEMLSKNGALQAANLELQTANARLQSRLGECTKRNAGPERLSRVAGHQRVVLDARLRLIKATPEVGRLFRFSAMDVRRPITDFKLALDYPDMERDLWAVLESQTPRHREVFDDVGQRWLLTMWPLARDGIDNVRVVMTCTHLP